MPTADPSMVQAAGERGRCSRANAGTTNSRPEGPRAIIRAMENFAEAPGLISEQLWDLPSHGGLRYSYPSGSAMPLAWAHAEYIKLVRSATDGAVFDLLPAVARRYLTPHRRSNLEIWNFYRQIDVIDRPAKLRIILPWPFRLRWSSDGWTHAEDDSTSPAPGLFLWTCRR